MIGPGEVMIALIVIGFRDALFMASIALQLREKQLDAEALLAAEKAAQYAASNTSLRRVSGAGADCTDGGIQTAAQIEALRRPS
jgi:hypothetical protein